MARKKKLEGSFSFLSMLSDAHTEGTDEQLDEMSARRVDFYDWHASRYLRKKLSNPRNNIRLRVHGGDGVFAEWSPRIKRELEAFRDALNSAQDYASKEIERLRRTQWQQVVVALSRGELQPSVELLDQVRNFRPNTWRVFQQRMRSEAKWCSLRF